MLAKFTISGGDEIEIMLSKLGATSVETGKKAVREAADIVADKVRGNLDKLPKDTFRKLSKEEKFKGIPEVQKKDLLDNMGITPVGVTDDGVINVKVGFHGYGSIPTKSYPKGLPNQLLARAVESGSSVRKKTPFLRPAINQTETKAIEKMQEVITREIENL
jgi:HK97 gp10 family phage protein